MFRIPKQSTTTISKFEIILLIIILWLLLSTLSSDNFLISATDEQSLSSSLPPSTITTTIGESVSGAGEPLFDRLEQWHDDISNVMNPFNIVIDRINGSTFKIYRNLSTYRVTNDYPKQLKNPDKLKIKIRYQLIANNLHLPPHQTNLCDKNETLARNYAKIGVLSTLNVIACKDELYGFGRYDDPLLKNYSYIERYCEPQYVFLDYVKSGKDNFTLLNDLLPHQAYQFHHSIIYENTTVTSESLFDQICTPEGPPRYSPQTDLSSFRFVPVSKNVSKTTSTMTNNYVVVELYWRPVPMPFVSSADFSYRFQCEENEEGHNFSAYIDHRSGKKDIWLPAERNYSYTCNISSVNHLGEAYLSPFVVPAQDNMIDYDDMELYAAAVSEGGYLLSWPNMESLLLRQDKTKDVIETGRALGKSGVYTVYWCLVMSPEWGCRSLQGMGKTNDTVFSFQFHNVGGISKSRSFGLSFRYPDSNFSTGIIWSDCVANVHSQADTAISPLTIVKAIGVSDDYSHIHLVWAPKGCKSIYALVDAFEINYCEVGRSDPCSLGVSKNRSREVILNFDFDQSKNCLVLPLVNNNIPTNEVIIGNLHAATEYAIRVRHVITEEKLDWSDPIFTQTIPTPEMLKDCFPPPELGHLALIMISFLIGCMIIVAIVHSARKRYNEFTTRLNEANCGMPQRVENIYKDDDLSEIGLKYWINRHPTPISASGSTNNSESSLNIYWLDQKNQKVTLKKAAAGYTNGVSYAVQENDYDDPDENAHLEDHHDVLISDYIPSQLLTRTTDQSTPENLSESTSNPTNDQNESFLPESDEVSITSHSSFLETILNPK